MKPEANETPVDVKISNPNDPLWFVFCEGHSTPTAKHATEEIAKAEAARICKKTGRRCHVLRNVSTCAPGGVTWLEVLR